ncbi:9642_t:CDS:10 [Paraglomus brasilianum]|uniref:9642_t:CDS:1 n=1 Tax=Paraglomus brasilianum TaxID=144538 RepID=A0A9N9ASQ2_9GLOM|nr:9642_t:CDS:10 [Paraglomus brasilianum]
MASTSNDKETEIPPQPLQPSLKQSSISEKQEQIVISENPVGIEGERIERGSNLYISLTIVDEKQQIKENAGTSAPANKVKDVVRQQNLEKKSSYKKDNTSFDFNRFLEQMKHKSTQSIAKYVKSFEKEFARKPWTVNEQIKIIHDFLEFITLKMRETEMWQNSSEQEFENAREGMEKLVMNRIFTLTFTPAIKGPVTTDDRERDDILHQRIQIFRWVREQHLDIPITRNNESFLNFAKSELLKINNYKAPRDKLICILNCCKVIFGLLRLVDEDEGADKFLPVLIFVVLRANPPDLVSNVQYISRFRNPDKLVSEAGYYLSSLMGAISFIENMDESSLSITKEEFDNNIEITMKELERERPKPEENDSVLTYDNVVHPRSTQSTKSPLLNSAQAKAFLEKGSNFAQRTIQKPLNMMNKFLSEIANDLQDTPLAPPTPPRPSSNTLDIRSSSNISPRSLSPHGQPSSFPQGADGSNATVPAQRRQRTLSDSSHSSRTSNDFSDVQTEVARISEAEYRTNMETLRVMFPNVDPDVCEVVFQVNECRLYAAIEKLLEISDPTRNDGEYYNSISGQGGDPEKDELYTAAT